MLALGGLFFISLFLSAAMERQLFPFELEWMEGGSADHVKRILDGKPYYGPPSMDFTPFIYTPFYYYLSALVSQFIGFDLGTMRLISLLATCACFAFIVAFVLAETRPSGALPTNGGEANAIRLQRVCFGLAAAGIYAACYALAGSFFDIGRVDALFVALVFGSAYLLRFGTGYRALVASSLLMVLAFATKQNGLLIAAALSLYSLLVLPGNKRLVFPGLSFGLILVGCLVANVISDGWFYFYVFEVGRNHDPLYGMIHRFWTEDIGRPLWIALFISLAFLLSLVAKRDKERAIFYGAFISSLMLVSWSSRIHAGGYINVLMPALAALSLCFGLGLQSAIRKSLSLAPAARLALQVTVVVAGTAQFVQLRYDKEELLPSAQDYRAGEVVLEAIKSFPGDVLIPDHGYLTHLAGKPSFAHSLGIGDITRSHLDAAVHEQARAAVRERLAQHPFDAIILDNNRWHLKDVKRFYTLERSLFDSPGEFDEDVFYPIIGKHTRPHLLYRLDPKKLEASRSRSRKRQLESAAVPSRHPHANR